MAANHDLISAINPAKESWTIKARVVRLWSVSDFNRQALPFSISKVPSLDVVVQVGPSGESIAQDLMPKFVDVVVHTQSQYTDPKIDVVGTDSVALNPADVDVSGDNSVNDKSSQNVVSLTHDTVVSSALNADPGDKINDLPNVPNVVTPVKRGLIGSVDEESGIIPKKAIKIEKD